MTGLLNLLPIAYSLRIETASGQRLERMHSPVDAPAEPEPAREVVVPALRVVEHHRRHA